MGKHKNKPYTQIKDEKQYHAQECSMHWTGCMSSFTGQVTSEDIVHHSTGNMQISSIAASIDPRWNDTSSAPEA